MIGRLWRLLEPRERRRVVGIAPLLMLSGLVEVVGVAAVIPFLAVLTDPGSVAALPLVGPSLAPLVARDPGALLRGAGWTLAGVVVLANALVIATTYWLYRFSWGLHHAISARLLRHYLAQPFDFALTRHSAGLANRLIVDVRQLVNQGFQAALEVVTRSVTVLALVTFLVVLNPLTAALSFTVLGAAYGAIFLLARRYLRRIGRESVTVGAARLKAIHEALGGFKELRVAGRETAAHARYRGPSRRYGEIQAAVAAIGQLPRYALEAVAVGGLVVIAALLAGRAGGAAVGTLPLLGAYAFAGLRMMPAMQVLFHAITRLRFAGGALQAIETDLARSDELERLADAEADPPAFASSIELRGVRYAYPGADEPALDGVTLTIERHRSLAIVGRTGSGKTTLVDVLLGLLRPQSGELRLDGAAVPREGLRAYRRLFGYVPQSIFLLDDTVARNVAFGVSDERIDHEAVRRACRSAQIAGFIERELPHGYATEVGERGVRLSGGERQRIGIARALYHQPEVLVFDEATSALDVHTERLLYDALEGIARERTVVTIAHRLETAAKSDRVVVLERGRAVDDGPPAEVLRRYRAAEAVGDA